MTNEIINSNFLLQGWGAGQVDFTDMGRFDRPRIHGISQHLTEEQIEYYGLQEILDNLYNFTTAELNEIYQNLAVQFADINELVLSQIARSDLTMAGLVTLISTIMIAATQFFGIIDWKEILWMKSNEDEQENDTE